MRRAKRCRNCGYALTSGRKSCPACGALIPGRASLSEEWAAPDSAGGIGEFELGSTGVARFGRESSDPESDPSEQLFLW